MRRWRHERRTREHQTQADLFRAAHHPRALPSHLPSVWQVRIAHRHPTRHLPWLWQALPTRHARVPRLRPGRARHPRATGNDHHPHPDTRRRWHGVPRVLPTRHRASEARSWLRLPVQHQAGGMSTRQQQAAARQAGMGSPTIPSIVVVFGRPTAMTPESTKSLSPRFFSTRHQALRSCFFRAEREKSLSPGSGRSQPQNWPFRPILSTEGR